MFFMFYACAYIIMHHLRITYAPPFVCVCIHHVHHTCSLVVRAPPIHIGTYTYVYPLCVHGVGYPPTTRCTHTYIPLCIYLCVYAGTCTTYPGAEARAHGCLHGVSMRRVRCGSQVRVRRVASPPATPPRVLRVQARGLAPPPHPCCHTGMDTSTAPYISPVLEPETMTALMLRYVEDNEEAAYQYARALVRRFTADLSVHDALRLAHDIITESTNDIRDFEGEEAAGRVDVALRRLIDRVEAEPVD